MSTIKSTTCTLYGVGRRNDDTLVRTELVDGVGNVGKLILAAWGACGCQGGEACQGEDVGELHVGNLVS